MNRYILAFICLILFSCGTPSVQQEEKTTLINFSDSTFVDLTIAGISETETPVKISLSYYQIIPGWTQSTQTEIISKDTSLQYQISPQHPYLAEVRLNQTAIPFFVSPGDSVHLRLDLKRLPLLTETVSIDKHQAETAYLLQKADALGDHKMKVFPIYDQQNDLNAIGKSMDSLAAIEYRFFYSYPDSAALSPCFKSLEENQILFGNAENKLYAEGYIRGYLGKEVHSSAGFYDFIDALDLKKEDAVFSPNYLDFLDLLGYHYCKDAVEDLDRTERSKILLSKETAYYDRTLSQETADLAKARTLTRTAARLYPQLREPIDQYVNELTNDRLRQYAHHFNQQYDLSLKEGDKAPDFYLFNEREQDYQLTGFADSLVYISFWATWCKPCIQEFEHENRLVEQFRNQPVKIISICLDSDRVKWLKSIEQHGLKTLNLYAEGNWNNKLKEGYGTSGYPHYVLIDEKGNLIQNKTLRPSEKVDSLINHFLKD